MGVVYRAQDPTIGRIIAIKTIRLTDLTEPGERERLRERLFREAQSAGILSHPNIVTIYDILEEQGLAYIFMEFVNGPTLDKQLGSDQPPNGATLLNVLRQTASALDYAHKKGIVHRDIKPANLMIHDDGAAKITDFGVAKIVSQQMTQSGAMMGTPTYMSPEQIQGGAVDGRADQFSLAVIAYEVLTGEKPFVAEYLPSLLYKICREEPAAPQHLNPTLSAEVEVVLRKALAKASNDRFDSCSDFVRDLERACAATPGWMPLPRGSIQNMPTVATTGAAPVIVPPAPPKPADPAPVLSVPPRQREPRDAAPESHTLRNIALAAAAFILTVLAILLAQKWTGSRPSAVPPADQTAAAPAPDASKPAASAPAPEPDKPSPVARPEDAAAVRKATPPPVKPAEPGDVAVQFSTAPGGAHVVIDHNAGQSCTSPCSLPLSPGRHTLSVSLDGYRDAQRIFELPQDATVIVDLERQLGTLAISSSPNGASIYLNGQARPEKTPAVLKLPAGSYKLQVVKDSLKYEETVVVRDGAMYNRDYRLE